MTSSSPDLTAGLGFWPAGLGFCPAGLGFCPAGLGFWPAGLGFCPAGLGLLATALGLLALGCSATLTTFLVLQAFLAAFLFPPAGLGFLALSSLPSIVESTTSAVISGISTSAVISTISSSAGTGLAKMVATKSDRRKTYFILMIVEVNLSEIRKNIQSEFGRPVSWNPH